MMCIVALIFLHFVFLTCQYDQGSAWPVLNDVM